MFAVLVVGLIAVLGFNRAIDSSHRNRLEPAAEKAAVLADQLSYIEVRSAWEDVVLATDGPASSELDAMLSIGPDLTPSTISDPDGNILIGYQIETFGRTSCVVVALSANGSATGVTDGRCGVSALPPNVQVLITG